MLNVRIALFSFLAGSTVLNGTSQNLHDYVWATFSHLAKKNNAQELLKQVVEHGQSPYRLKSYLLNLDQQNKSDEIIRLMQSSIDANQKNKLLKDLFENDAEMQLLLAKSYFKAGNQKKAEELFIALNKRFENNPEITLLAAESHLKQRNTKDALETIEKFLNTNPSKPTHYLFYFLQSQALYHSNKTTDALKSIKKSVKLHPGFAQGWLLRAMLEEQLGLTPAAVQSYQRFLTESGINNAEIMKKLFDLQKKARANIPAKHSLRLGNHMRLPIMHQLKQFICATQDHRKIAIFESHLLSLSKNSARLTIYNNP